MYGPSATCFSRARPSKYLVGETEANREARENGLAGREQLPTRGSDGRENMTRLECYAWKRSDLSGEAGDNQTTRLDSTMPRGSDSSGAWPLRSQQKSQGARLVVLQEFALMKAKLGWYLQTMSELLSFRHL